MKKNVLLSFLVLVLPMIGTNGIADISYPESLNREIRCYPHAEITQTLDASDTKMATLLVTDRFSKIPDFYTVELNKTGWKINNITEGGNRVTIDAEKEGKTLLINAELHKSGDSTIKIIMNPN